MTLKRTTMNRGWRRSGMTLVTVTLLMAGCSSDGGSTLPALPAEIEVGYGQAVTLASGFLALEFSELSEDSRCPTGVQCIWAGNARIVVRATQPGRNLARLELNTAPNFARLADYGGYRIELLALTPHPVRDRPEPASRYAAKLRVSIP
jgi:hypothetical protein